MKPWWRIVQIISWAKFTENYQLGEGYKKMWNWISQSEMAQSNYSEKVSPVDRQSERVTGFQSWDGRHCAYKYDCLGALLLSDLWQSEK